MRDRRGPARLLDMVEGRSKQVFSTWLGTRPTSWREAIAYYGGFEPLCWG